METGAVYSEAEVNDGLTRWLEAGCPSLGLDVVTLRRELVDRLYLDRDDAGTNYSPGPGPTGWRFADDVGSVDPTAVIEEIRKQRAARKAAHMSGESQPIQDG